MNWSIVLDVLDYLDSLLHMEWKTSAFFATLAIVIFAWMWYDSHTFDQELKKRRRERGMDSGFWP